eukprot:m.81294 g.81294  ORF g.81294 m.81294 type:complete len:126 (-) comp12628_c1_seq2:341-718(-)
MESESSSVLAWLFSGTYHVLLAIVGVGFGVVSLLPNAMLSDSGTAKATKAAQLGLTASGCFIVGGVAGLITGSAWCLLPGLVLQLFDLSQAMWATFIICFTKFKLINDALLPPLFGCAIHLSVWL